MIKKPQTIQMVYNDGLAKFKSKQIKKDKFGTVIRGEIETTIEHEQWFRYLGITASDVYYAHADDEDLNLKIAIKGNQRINSKWLVEIHEVDYEVYRVYYNHKRRETEISLLEV